MIGRFASADPITEAPASSQGWNRYSYVGNSPVNFTDPSGYCFMGCFWNKAFRGVGALIKKYPIIGSVIKIAATAICVALAGPGCGPVMAFITSAFVTGVTGGSLGQALKSGLIAAATAVAFNIAGGIAGGLDGGAALAKGGFGAGFGTAAHIFKIASHAAIGCLSAMAGGGKCGAGALSAGVSAGATPFYSTGSTAGNVAAAALVGGTASKLGGGSFSDGAATAAFGYLFNHLATAGAAAGGVAGSGAAAACAWLTAGVCAPAAPYIIGAGVSAGIALGLYVTDQILGGLVFSRGYRDTALDEIGATRTNPPLSDYPAHHIVQQGGSSVFAAISQQMLANAGIDIHSADNLELMPSVKHADLHTEQYRSAVAGTLSAGWATGGAAGVQSSLAGIKATLILKGSYP